MGETSTLPSDRSPDDVVAVIGMACRLPGARTPDQLWRHLLDGTDLVREAPTDRVAGARWGGFVDEVTGFDHDFFGIGAHEATEMDPQQRLLLMTAWDALEDAGQPAAQLAGTRTAVYVGQSHGDHWDTRGQRPAGLGLASMIGGEQRAMAAGRLSYHFDLRGVSVTVDAAQASSGVAVHLAAQSLRTGDAELALAAGVNLVLGPTPAMIFERAGVLAADGRCKFGDASADGFVRSDGVVVVVLKPLAAALAAGDRVRAVLHGSAVSNDGRSKSTLTAASVTGQRLAMRWAYRAGGVDPAEVDYVEAHGTGTGIDTVELTALAEVLGENRPAGRPCPVGSVKTNIGHTEAAAGLAGMLKAVLCLEHGVVPPSLHHHTPHPGVDWERVPLVVPTAVRRLPVCDRPSLVAVNGQSMSGVNVHLVLGTAPRPAATRTREAAQPYRLLLSAHTADALDDLVRAWVTFLEPGGAGQSLALRDICHTASDRRTRHAVRVIVTGAIHDELAAQLRHRLLGAADPAGAPAAGELVAGTHPGARVVPLPPYPWRTRPAVALPS